MDLFENVVPEMENDPAAEFLAREENALADIENNQIGNNDDNNDDDLFQNNNNIDDNASNNEKPIDNFDMINGNGETDDDDQFITNHVTKPSKVDSEKIRKWREEQIEILQKKDEEEEIKKQELLEQAKNELADWYKKHNELIGKTKKTNRNADQQHQQQINNSDDGMAMEKTKPGTVEWERISKLCDFKTNKSNKDVSRMRSILLQLKQN